MDNFSVRYIVISVQFVIELWNHASCIKNYYKVCETRWRHRKPFWMATRWKQSYITPPLPFLIVLASSVKILEVKAFEFHRICQKNRSRWKRTFVAGYRLCNTSSSINSRLLIMNNETTHWRPSGLVHFSCGVFLIVLHSAETASWHRHLIPASKALAKSRRENDVGPNTLDICTTVMYQICNPHNVCV